MDSNKSRRRRRKPYTLEELYLIADFPGPVVRPYLERLYRLYRHTTKIESTKHKHPGSTNLADSMRVNQKTVGEILDGKKEIVPFDFVDKMCLHPYAHFRLDEITEDTIKWAAEQKRKKQKGGNWPRGYEPHAGTKRAQTLRRRKETENA